MEHFKPCEFVDRVCYARWGDNCMRYIDVRLPVIMDFLREKLGRPITINNWQTGGPFEDRGLRDATSGDFLQFSDHTYGRAIDFNVQDISDADVQKAILNEYTDDLITLGVTGIEDGTPTWTHIGVSDLTGWGFKQVNGLYLIPRPALTVK